MLPPRHSVLPKDKTRLVAPRSGHNDREQGSQRKDSLWSLFWVGVSVSFVGGILEHCHRFDLEQEFVVNEVVYPH